MNISLVGYRGTGKSSLAPLIAGQLEWTFVDADRELERREGRSISELFATQGETYFREREAALLQDLYQQDQLVIATGGGAVLNAQTRQRMREKGPVIWLQTELETILARITQDATTAGSRPALTKLPVKEEIAQLLALREPIYREVSHVQIDTTGKSPAEIVQEIRIQLQQLPAELQPQGKRER